MPPRSIKTDIVNDTNNGLKTDLSFGEANLLVPFRYDQFRLNRFVRFDGLNRLGIMFLQPLSQGRLLHWRPHWIRLCGPRWKYTDNPFPQVLLSTRPR